MAHVTDRPTGGVVLLDENDAAAVEIDKSTKTVTIYGSPLVSGGGTPGPPGAPGAPGAAGADGASGAQGRPGMDGTDGDDGAQGPPGTAGAAGAPGAQGPQGLNGSNGVDGQDGDDGFPGPPGTPGAAGAAGSAGAPGATGLAGPPGQDGEDAFDWPLPGPQGIAGSSGAPGAAGAQGLMGPPGADGDEDYNWPVPGPQGPTSTAAGTRVWLSANQSVTNGSNTKVLLDTVERDDGAWWNASTKAIVIPQSGWYVVTLGVDWNTEGTVEFRVFLQDVTGGTFPLVSDMVPGASVTPLFQGAHAALYLTAGHSYVLGCVQNTLGAVQVNTSQLGTFLSIVGPIGAMGPTGPAGPTGPTVQITQVEVDFGTTPVADATFTITDPLCTTQSKIIPHLAGDAPTGKDVDEITMDDLFMVATPGVGTFDLYISGQEGYVADKFKINYLLTTPGF